MACLCTCILAASCRVVFHTAAVVNMGLGAKEGWARCVSPSVRGVANVLGSVERMPSGELWGALIRYRVPAVSISHLSGEHAAAGPVGSRGSRAPLPAYLIT